MTAKKPTGPWLVVHPAVAYPSTTDGALVERHAGDTITDITPDNWLIAEGLVVPLPAHADPAALVATYSAAQPPPDVTVAFIPVEGGPADE